MGSVSRKFRRNILAREMATKAGIVPPVVVYRDPDGNEAKRVFLRRVPLVFYRSVMLKIKAKNKKARKFIHHDQQSKAALKEKRIQKPQNEGSMVRRFFRGLFRRKGNR